MTTTIGGGAGAKGTGWGLVVLLGALTAFAPMAIDMYLPSLPAIGADLGVDAAYTQITVSAFLAGMAIGQFFYGPASDRLGRKGPILAGVALCNDGWGSRPSGSTLRVEAGSTAPTSMTWCTGMRKSWCAS
jgi:MFS family permease